jgi:hypothetical protein
MNPAGSGFSKVSYRDEFAMAAPGEEHASREIELDAWKMKLERLVRAWFVAVGTR